MSDKKLKNAPLQEVIFELKWELALDEQGLPYDPGFDNALGVFAKEVEYKFPIQKQLLPPNSPINTSNTLTHQFWQNELVWPVIQIGRGILTVNDIEGNYEWAENYRPIVELAVKSFVSSYKGKLSFNHLSLHYIDAVDVSDDVTSSSEYIAGNFRTRIINDYPTPGRHGGIDLSQWFNLDDGSLMGIQIQTAINNRSGSRAIVWATEMRKTGSIQENEIIDWLDYAHSHCSSAFKDMLNPEFYASFNK